VTGFRGFSFPLTPCLPLLQARDLLERRINAIMLLGAETLSEQQETRSRVELQPSGSRGLCQRHSRGLKVESHRATKTKRKSNGKK